MFQMSTKRDPGLRREAILQREFDAVVMLTWSNWKTEPRSNRYHYATRFARELPVLFVQPDSTDGEITSEPVPGTNIEIIHVSGEYGPMQSKALKAELCRRGVSRPLLWIYNVFFEHFVSTSSTELKIYHATEDYLTPPDGWAAGDDVVRAPLIRLLNEVDLVVAVSKGVAESYRDRGGYTGETLILTNGCDFAFWKASGAAAYRAPENEKRVALFQGGINARLDFALLTELASLMPDWEFWFCGHDGSGGSGWETLRTFSNVAYLGNLTPEEIARTARSSLVGLIPFKQDELIRRSLPLKAYEYAACGLPVVTVPIDALEALPSVFRRARTAAEFANAISNLAPSRTDQFALEERLAAAANNSYDKHFYLLTQNILEVCAKKRELKGDISHLISNAQEAYEAPPQSGLPEKNANTSACPLVSNLARPKPTSQTGVATSSSKISLLVRRLKPVLRATWHTVPARIRVRCGPSLRRQAISLYTKAKSALSSS